MPNLKRSRGGRGIVAKRRAVQRTSEEVSHGCIRLVIVFSSHGKALREMPILSTVAAAPMPSSPFRLSPLLHAESTPESRSKYPLLDSVLPFAQPLAAAPSVSQTCRQRTSSSPSPPFLPTAATATLKMGDVAPTRRLQAKSLERHSTRTQ